MEYKLLEADEINLMKEIVEDDDMKFDILNLKEFINQKGTYGFIAKDNNKIVGFAYSYSLKRPDGDNMLYLHSIGMLPGYQNKGIGTNLMNYIINYAKLNKFSEVFVITDKGNPRACHVYEKCGGRNNYEDEIVYVYDLKSIYNRKGE